MLNHLMAPVMREHRARRGMRQLKILLSLCVAVELVCTACAPPTRQAIRPELTYGSPKKGGRHGKRTRPYFRKPSKLFRHNDFNAMDFYMHQHSHPLHSKHPVLENTEDAKGSRKD